MNRPPGFVVVLQLQLIPEGLFFSTPLIKLGVDHV
jgi:hypothetical protein